MGRDSNGGALYFDCPSDVMMARLNARVHSSAAKGKPVREDDQMEGIAARRIRVFKEETVPVLDKLRGEGKLLTVDASGSVAEVARLTRALVVHWKEKNVIKQ